jgi:hypothetical protein
MRVSAPLLVALWLMAYAAPSWVVLRFELDRDRIVREDCVQRGVPLAERTCFGQCHLVKELNDLKDQDPQQGEPTSSAKWDPEALPLVDTQCSIPLGDHRSGPRPLISMRVLDGHPLALEGVPWG